MYFTRAAKSIVRIAQVVPQPVQTSENIQELTIKAESHTSGTNAEEFNVPDARNKKLFKERVDTFSPLQWFAKPLELSPLVCARYGWKNTDTDMLQCVNCKAFICGQLPKAVDTRNYRDSCNKFKKELVDGHEKLCKWSSSSCPESFLYVPYHDREELLSNFWFKMTSLQCAKIPTVSFKSIEEKGVTAESMMSYARTIASHSSSEIVASDSTIICALCGWHYSESQVDILQCNFCCRKIGLWNYQFENTEQMTPSVGSDSFKETRINGNTLTEKSNGCVCSDQSNGIHKNGSEKTNVDQNTCHVNGDPSKREGEPNDKNTNNMDGQINKINEQDLECDGPVRKRPRLEKQQFDPVSEHRYWCPWLQTGSQNIASGERLHKDTSPAGSPVKSQTTSEEREPAWLKVTKILCHRLDDGDNDSCRQLKRSPQAEGLRHLRKVLRECTSPKKPEKDLQQ